MPAKSATVRGRVQGVGFRYWVNQQAAAMGITGEVWNKDDRSVGVIAYHDSALVLDEFLARLKSGPGRVDSVDVVDEPGLGGVTDFRIVSKRV